MVDKSRERGNSEVGRKSNGPTPSLSKSICENENTEAMIPRPTSTYLEEEVSKVRTKKHFYILLKEGMLSRM